ncbi:MAG: glucose-1-phosphate adenylyltransferase subunit GlgD [Lachnospirales bacterium]
MKAIGIILAGGKGSRLSKLTESRATAAIPLGSSYRAIDWPLSNMTDSGINKVAVITQYNSRSLTDHLSSSKWWNFGRKHGGLFILSPYLANDSSLLYKGTADSMYQNLSFLKRSNEEFVVITNGEGIYSGDYNYLLEHHVEKNADLTMVVKRIYDDDIGQYGVVQMDDNNRLLYLEEKPLAPETNLVNLAIYVIRRELLIKLLEELSEDLRYDFVTDLIVRYRKKLNISCFQVNDDFYWRTINSVQNYYRCNMDFLDEKINMIFNHENHSICTKPKDEPPAKYNFNAEVRNALVGNGSIISGKVENSVLFRRVVVKDNACVERSILLEGTIVEEGCTLKHVITDRNCRITSGTKIIGTEEEPIILGKNTVV